MTALSDNCRSPVPPTPTEAASGVLLSVKLTFTKADLFIMFTLYPTFHHALRLDISGFSSSHYGRKKGIFL